MLKLLDRRHAPATPKSFQLSNGHRITWNSTSQPFENFASTVQAYAQRNGIEVPSIEQIEDRICHQLARGWCSENPNASFAPAPAQSSGCKSCGR